MNRHELAGLLSTLDFRPADEHPEACLPMADQILAWLAEQAALPVDEIKAAMLTVRESVRCGAERSWLPSIRPSHECGCAPSLEAIVIRLITGQGAHSDPVDSPSERPPKGSAPPQEVSQKYPGSMWEV